MGFDTIEINLVDSLLSILPVSDNSLSSCICHFTLSLLFFNSFSRNDSSLNFRSIAALTTFRIGLAFFSFIFLDLRLCLSPRLNFSISANPKFLSHSFASRLSRVSIVATSSHNFFMPLKSLPSIRDVMSLNCNKG